MVIKIVMGDRGRRVYDQTTELPLPELIGASDILNEELRRKVCKMRCLSPDLTSVRL